VSDQAERLAARIWAEARSAEQCVRPVPDDVLAAEVRRRVRRLAAADGVRVRTARIGDSVVVVRLDAAVWTQDAATMRRKLAPGARVR
jgi:hypothetical protein